MKRLLFLLVAVVAVVGLAASCGGGGDDGDYNFNGRWLAMFSLVTSDLPGVPPSGGDVILISQDGTNVTVRFESTGDIFIMRGTCDPKAKTFSATGTGTGRYAGIRNDVTGAGVDDDSMSGTWTISKGGLFSKYTWTANLGSRNLTLSTQGSSTGFTVELLKAFSR